MTELLVTLGVPVFAGAEALPGLLRCLCGQTWRRLDILVSVDGADAASAEAARPFLADPRVRLVVQSDRLGWAGNTDFTIRNRLGDFWIYMQHDDLLSPDYVARLVEAAQAAPGASLLAAEMRIVGTAEGLAVPAEITGSPLERAFAYIESLESTPFRGLIRSAALDRSGGLASGPHDSFGAFYLLMVELALAGEFRFVRGPTYFKVLHGRNLHLKWYDWPEDSKRDAWTALGASLGLRILRAAADRPDRAALVAQVVERFVVREADRWHFPAVMAEANDARDLLERMVAHFRAAGPEMERALGQDWASFAQSLSLRLGGLAKGPPA